MAGLPVAVTFELHPIGRVRSPIQSREQAPKQGDEEAPEAWLEIDPAVAEAARHLRVGEEVILLTWLDRADRSVLLVHPRGDERRPLTGVFSTRSPDRPNPIGLHRVTVLEVAGGLRFRVSGLEALDRTPILDIKPVLRRVREH
jgi:tRNA-Thr(GGU) m(6)t(6)A37 methyltransferase TsaA